jgi:hypothetical protein
MKTLRVLFSRRPQIRAFSQVAFEEGKQLLNAGTQKIGTPLGLKLYLNLKRQIEPAEASRPKYCSPQNPQDPSPQ